MILRVFYYIQTVCTLLLCTFCSLVEVFILKLDDEFVGLKFEKMLNLKLGIKTAKIGVQNYLLEFAVILP